MINPVKINRKTKPNEIDMFMVETKRGEPIFIKASAFEIQVNKKNPNCHFLCFLDDANKIQVVFPSEVWENIARGRFDKDLFNNDFEMKVRITMEEMEKGTNPHLTNVNAPGGSFI